MGEKKIQINLGGMLGVIDIDEWGAVKLCNALFSAIAEYDIIDELKSYPYSAGGNERDDLRNSMIKILEERFGLKIKICGNCRCFYSMYGGVDSPGFTPGCEYEKGKPTYLSLREVVAGCKDWQRREVSAKSAPPPFPPNSYSPDKIKAV